MLRTFIFSTFLLSVFLITGTVLQRGKRTETLKPLHPRPGEAHGWQVGTSDRRQTRSSSAFSSSLPSSGGVDKRSAERTGHSKVEGVWRGWCRLGRIVCLCAVSLSIQRIIHQSSACTQLQTFSMSQLLIVCRGMTPERPKCKAKASPSLLLGDGLQHRI